MQGAEGAALGLREDPRPGFRFRVEIDGRTLAAFRECAGLAAWTEVVEIREGGRNDGAVPLPGRTSYSPLTLARGIVADAELWEWHRQVVEGGDGARRTGDVILCDDSGGEAFRWTFIRGWPSRWEGPVLVAGFASIAVEVVEIVHEGLVMAR